MRGSDIDYNPVFLSYLLLEFNGSTSSGHLFTNKDRLEAPVHQYLADLHIKIHDYEDIASFLHSYASSIFLEKAACNYSLIHSIANQSLVINKTSPISMMKAVKNEREVRGMRECHIRDGAAVVAYLAWLGRELVEKKRTDLDEFSAASQLEDFRKVQKLNKGLSFDTISAIGPNGAIVHYKPEEKNAAKMVPDQVYLLDSGGQYLYALHS